MNNDELAAALYVEQGGLVLLSGQVEEIGSILKDINCLPLSIPVRVVAASTAQEYAAQARLAYQMVPEIAEGTNVDSVPNPWFMDHRIRLAFHGSLLDKASGHVEADETFIGQKARNMHASVRARKITGTGGKDKTAVMGILERGKDGKHSTVRTTVVPNRRKAALQPEVRKHVEAGSALYTDALKSYDGLTEFEHQVVDHAVEYVNGNIHTNGLENFWSLLKRGIRGTYVSVEPFHLFRYLDEQVCRFNNRKLTDAERFSIAVTGMVGKRLTFDQLTGKTNPEAFPN